MNRAVYVRNNCRGGLIAALVLTLAACASPGPAPVRERSGSLDRTAPDGDPRDYYTVKKGDTLYSIAFDHRRDYKDLAAWNNLGDANVIRIGQQLRVRPPDSAAAAAGDTLREAGAGESGVIANPVILDPSVDAPGEEPGAAAPAVSLKREPKVGKQPYSVEALAQLRRGDELERAGAATQVAITAPANEIDAGAKALEGKPGEAGSEVGPNDVNNAGGVEWGWPGRGKLIGRFDESANKGVDIAGKPGEPVYAAASGRVTYVGSGIRGYGNLVIIMHDNDYISAYAHNRKILVKEKQRVDRGQKIAELGDSDANQPKLHFEIRRKAMPVDPLKYLPSR